MPPQHAGVAAELPLPESVAENHDGRGTRILISLPKEDAAAATTAAEASA